MARLIAWLLGGCLLAAAAGAGTALFLKLPIAADLFGPERATTIYRADVDQLIKKLEAGMRLDDEITLLSPFKHLQAGQTVTVFELVVMNSSPAFLRYLASNWPAVSQDLAVKGLCAASAAGTSNVVPLLVEKLGGPVGTVVCANGRKPSEVAQSAGHGGTKQRLEAFGL